jgi:acetolactate synthase-1/2/3 large subunit
VGYNIAEYPPYLWNGKLDKKIINIDFVESVPDRYFNPTVEIIGDVTSSIRELASSIQEKREFPFFEKTRYFIEKKINVIPPLKYPTLPQSVVQSIRKVLGREDIITLDNGIYKLWFSRLYKTYAPLILYFLTMPLQLWAEDSQQGLLQNLFILNAECL